MFSSHIRREYATNRGALLLCEFGMCRMSGV
jgi:hypothetical protein